MEMTKRWFWDNREVGLAWDGVTSTFRHKRFGPRRFPYWIGFSILLGLQEPVVYRGLMQSGLETLAVRNSGNIVTTSGHYTLSFSAQRWFVYDDGGRITECNADGNEITALRWIEDTPVLLALTLWVRIASGTSN